MALIRVLKKPQMQNEEISFNSWNFDFIRMWLRWKLQVLLSGPRKLGNRRVQSAIMQGRWKLHRNFTGIRSKRNNNDTGDSRTMKKRLTPAELDARLKFVVGCVMATVLTLTTIGVIYALVFVTQPIGAQAENDKMFFSVLSSIATFITGTLAGLMISTGGNKEDKNGNGIPDDEE
jgi:hypothetical protein